MDLFVLLRCQTQDSCPHFASEPPSWCSGVSKELLHMEGLGAQPHHLPPSAEGLGPLGGALWAAVAKGRRAAQSRQQQGS